jgi:hypothetical protein
MILGELGRAQPTRFNPCGAQYAQCSRQSGRFGNRLQRQLACKIKLQKCQRLHKRPRHGFRDAELGSVEPYVTMASGVFPAWNPRDPRSQLTNAAAIAYQQSHPSMNGSGLGGFSLLAWLKGER